MIPNRDGTISGCYDNETGALRVADPEIGVPRPSAAGETALRWACPRCFSVTRAA